MIFFRNSFLCSPSPGRTSIPQRILRALIEKHPIADRVLAGPIPLHDVQTPPLKVFQSHRELSSADLDDLIAGPELAEEAACLSARVRGNNYHHCYAAAQTHG